MIRFALVACLIPQGTFLFGQELVGEGILAMSTISLPRTPDDAKASHALGDMLHVTVVQPARSGGMYVSVHPQVQRAEAWVDVTVADSALGKAYESGKFPGKARDYVFLSAVRSTTRRSVCLFIPYRAMSLAARKHEFRYVLRLWDREDKELDERTVTVPSREISVENDGEGNLIRVVTTRVRACTLAERLPAGSDLRPEPEVTDQSATFILFNADGEPVCRPERE